MSIKIFTDSSCDLPIELVKSRNIGLIPLTVNIKGEFIEDDLGQTLKYDDFYKLIRAGEQMSTAQVNVFTFEERFKEEIIKGNDIVYISISAELSGTNNSARIARENLLEEYPNAKIAVINSKGVTLGQGLLVLKAWELMNEGKTVEEIEQWVDDNLYNVQYAIVLDDLNHLKRGGRISATSAAIGSLLNVKPTLKITREGTVTAGVKLKGRKKAIKYLIEELKEKGKDLENQTIFVAHTDCIEDATLLKEKVQEELGLSNIIIQTIGPLIGTHAGPDALAIIYFGQERE